MVTGGGDGVGVCSRRRPREKKEKVFGDDIVSEGLGLGDIYPNFTKLEKQDLKQFNEPEPVKTC